jgi:putative spermidine/putrescine transport system ATP-binding protein
MNGGQGAVTIRLVNCEKTFRNGVRALQPINLEINASETVVLLGPSGCGKTTTLRIIAGLDWPDPGGRVLFNADDVTNVPIERRNVGMMFQSYALFPNMTVGENIEYGLRVRKVSQRDRARRVAEMGAMMRIEELRDRRIDELSGGQRQRVALARAIAVQPRVLLLDEPLTALDAKLRDALRVEVDSLLRQLGITAVYVTHDQSEAMALGDRIVVMNKGVVAQIGTPQEIYFEPASPFVADFIGTMNSMTGQSKDGSLLLGNSPLPWAGPDGEVRIMFRPHDAQLCELDRAHFVGSVISAQFLGDRTRLVVSAQQDTSIIVDCAQNRSPKKGETVGVRIDRERLVAL